MAALLLFHSHDEPALTGFQSGVYYADGTPKASLEPVREAIERRPLLGRCLGGAVAGHVRGIVDRADHPRPPSVGVEDVRGEREPLRLLRVGGVERDAHRDSRGGLPAELARIVAGSSLTSSTSTFVTLPPKPSWLSHST